MRYVVLAVSILIISCCSTKKTVQEANKKTDTSLVVTGKGTFNNADTNLTACIKKMITEFQQEEKQNPPRSVYRYTYNGKLVYYVPPVCCDFFSDLYDNECKLIAHPDGGFTGRGDDRAEDFIQTRTGEKLIWKDER